MLLTNIFSNFWHLFQSDCCQLLMAFTVKINHWFWLPGHDYVASGYLLSQIHLSRCSLLRGLQLSTIFLPHFVLIGILWPLCKILQRSSRGKPCIGDVKDKRGIVRSAVCLQVSGTWQARLISKHSVYCQCINNTIDSNNLAVTHH